MKHKRVYHVGFGKSKDEKTLYIYASEVLDCLPTNLWLYMGERITTKKDLKEQSAGIIQLVNQNTGKSFTRARIM